MTLFDHFVVLTFAVLYPAYAFFTYRTVKKDLIANKPGARTRDYKETIVWLWSLSVIAMGVWIYNDRLLADIGLGFSIKSACLDKSLLDCSWGYFLDLTISHN